MLIKISSTSLVNSWVLAWEETRYRTRRVLRANTATESPGHGPGRSWPSHAVVELTLRTVLLGILPASRSGQQLVEIQPAGLSHPLLTLVERPPFIPTFSFLVVFSGRSKADELNPYYRQWLIIVAIRNGEGSAVKQAPVMPGMNGHATDIKAHMGCSP